MSSSLKKSIANGFLWTAIQTVGTKIISFVSQIVLAWLLLPEDFGKITLTFSVTSIVFLIQGFGLSDVLISRSHMFSRLINLAKTISLTVAGIGIGVAIIASLLAGFIYEDVEITYLILIFSLSIPFNALSIVPSSKLTIDLKFKELSKIRLIEFFTSSLLTIILVLLKFDIYSFVIAPLVSSILRYVILHKISNIAYRFKITYHHWKYLFSKSLLGFLHSLSQTLIRQFDYMILGIYATKAVVGIYFMAYSLSVQVVGLLVNSLSPVLFPTLKKIPISETTRIREILVKITSIFSMFGMPFAFWQMYVAEPFIILFLNDKWQDSIILVKILSIGIGFSVASSVWATSLRLQSRFKEQAILSLSAAISFILITTVSAMFYKEIGVAIGVTIYQIIFSFIFLNGALKFYGVNFYRILKIVFKYFILSVLIFVALNELTFVKSNFIIILINSVIYPAIYFFVLYKFDKTSRQLLKQNFGGIISKISNKLFNKK